MGGDVGDAPLTGRALGELQHMVVKRITGRQPQSQLDGIWNYPLLDTAIQEAVFEEMEEYVLNR